MATLDRENVFLAEVTGWKKQIGVLGGVSVRYLDGEPYPGVTTDELPSDLVQLFQKRAELLRALLEQEPRLAEFTDEKEREEATRDAVPVVWRTAMRDFWLRWLKVQPSAGAGDGT